MKLQEAAFHKDAWQEAMASQHG